MNSIDFGWEIPTGKRRMPPGGPDAYEPHLRRVLAAISGHFHSAWMPDHFMSEADPVPESLTTLGYLAGLFPALTFGNVVIGQSYRNPALLAKMAATLQQLSGGRFVLGIGAGWKADEYRAYGYDYPPAPVRIAQLAEVVQICRAMWDPARPTATFHGQHHRIEGATCEPKPSPPPPVMIGGAGEKLMLRVIAQHADWWNLVGVTPQVYAHKMEVLARHCAEVGRDPAAIRKTWMGVVSVAPSRAAAEAAMQGYAIWPEDTPIVGTPAEVIAGLRAFTALGVNLFILGFAGEPALNSIELFIREVLPAFQD
ncbi:MAG: TIGR03560 family F420-dependent LLM class oxidoreductase [Anaerolineae bacterium]